ncbi:MAG: LptF/LptG family permease [Bacteroidota bacterium]
MKILDRYILITYLKTFVSVFLILMFIFVLQAIWLYIGDLAGKDLDTFVILKLLAYLTPTLVPLILPLTILLVSIMVFGAFAENYEFAAMKSTGISLQRAMRSLSLFIVFLGGVVFIFSNNVIPWANYNVYNLRKNIAKVKPALAITAGQFNEIGSYNIKVESKSGENDEFLKKVVIHEKSVGSSTNRKVIIADRGELKSSEDSNILQLVLFDGNRYEEIYNRRNAKQNLKKPHAKSFFETYTINVDIEGLNDVDIDDKSYDNKYNMLNISELEYTIDSLVDKEKTQLKNFSNTLYRRTSITTLNQNIEPEKDTIPSKPEEVLDLFPDRTKIQLLGLAGNTVNSTRQIIKSNENSFLISTKWLSKHIISLHEKYVLSLACIILFFVGAPLGALIRKGGIGLPLVIAILLFLTYHFIGIFAKNSSHDGTFSPILATWLSTAIMLPLSIYLTSRATKDRGIFEGIAIFANLKKLFGIKSPEVSVIPIGAVPQDIYDKLEENDNNSLIKTIKNFRQFKQGRQFRKAALDILKSRGLTEEELKIGGSISNFKTEETLRLYKAYNENSKFALILYLIAIGFAGLGQLLLSFNLEIFGISLFAFGCLVFLLFLITLVRLFITFQNLNKLSGETKIIKSVGFLLIGLTLFPVIYLNYRNKLPEDLNLQLQ